MSGGGEDVLTVLSCAAAADSARQRPVNFRKLICVPKFKSARLTVQPCHLGLPGLVLLLLDSADAGSPCRDA